MTSMTAGISAPKFWLMAIMSSDHTKINMASSGLRENGILYLSKIILTTDGIKVCKKGDMVPRVAPTGEDHTFQNVDVKCMATTSLWLRGCGPLWDCNSKSITMRWRAGVSYRTSSQMWGSWNLPMFLLRDRSFTLMYMASLMLLASMCASLPTMEKIVYSDEMTCGVSMVIDGGGNPEMFLEHILKSPCWLTYGLFLTTSLGTLEPIAYPTFLSDLIPVFWGTTGGSWWCLPLLKYKWIPTLLHAFMKLLLCPIVSVTTM